MAYKFQVGAATMSGSLTQEGAISCETSLTIGSAAMSEADLEKLDGITDGTAAANKAVVLDASKNIATIGTIGCGAITSTGNSTFGRVQIDSANDYIDVDTDLKIIAAADVVIDPAGGELKVDGNVVPNSDSADSLGASGTAWANLYVDAIDLNGQGSISMGGTGRIDLDADDDTSIRASADDVITFEAGGTDRLSISATALYPASDDGMALGSANNNFADAYFADGAVLNFGDDQEITLTHTADQGLTLASAGSDAPMFVLTNTNADAGGSTFAFFKDSASPADNDTVGNLDFYGDDDAGNQTLFGRVVVKSTDVSNGAEQGKMELLVSEFDGTATAGITLEGGSSDGVIDVTIGAGTTSTTTIAGNLTVNGTTTSVNSTTINITSSFTFEGPADAHETTLTAGTPTADITVTLPQYASAGTVHMAVLADATTAAAAAVTAAEFALLDGGTARGTTALASGDGFLHNDGGTMRMTSVDKIADFFAGDSLAASSGVLNVDIDGLSALGGTGLHQTQDHFMFSDNGTEKKITFSNLQDAVFADISGDATVAAGGALTIAAGAVEGSMIADDLISAQGALGGASMAQADLLLIDDGPGTVKKVTFSNFEDSIFGNVSGDATIAAGGALTIAANAVEGSMLNNNIVSGLTDIGAAIADTDELIISDAGTIRRTDMSRLKTYIGFDSTITEHGDAARTLVVGLNVATANTSTARTWTLPASPSAGDSVKIKVAAVSSGAITIAVDGGGSHAIDGSLSSIVLESDNTAIELIYVGDDDWRIF